jgi:hypothetical protein
LHFLNNTPSFPKGFSAAERNTTNIRLIKANRTAGNLPPHERVLGL